MGSRFEGLPVLPQLLLPWWKLDHGLKEPADKRARWQQHYSWP
jgi:hypothetical protein